MSWDGTGRRPIRDKQNENKYLRELTVGLMKLSSDDVVTELNIEQALIDDILHCRGIRDHRGRRRMERHITNQLRLAEVETLETIEAALDDPEVLLSQRQVQIDEQLVALISGGPQMLQDFVERAQIRDHADIQRLRQLTRNAQRAQNTARTSPRDSLRELVAKLMFGET